MKKVTMGRVFAVSLFVGAALSATAVQFEDRWFYVSRNLTKQEHVSDIADIVKTAKAADLNGMLLACNVERWDKWPADPTAPSPAAWIKKGATTLWEDWHDGSSRNHIMFGDFVAWSYQYLAGIRLAADAGSCAAIPVGSNAFRRFVLAPEVIPQLDYVDASVETTYGTVRSAWRRDGVKVKFRFTVPPGTVADVRWNGKTSVCGPGEYEY